jgi:lipopolysaccharide/colanic/teichoic acid biosynthesis glycosyltransferase
MTDPPRFEVKTDVLLSPWCNSVWHRLFDLFWALLLLIVSSPLMLVVALAVKVTSRGPVLFRQQRPGKNGAEFSILKFRTMVVTPPQSGPVLTRALDPRVTWLGRYIRKWKLDELPQLFNVLRGDMSFVGPRPQPTRLWTEPSIREDASVVLSVRPGVTSQATLVFRNEEEVLARFSGDEVEEVYVRTLMPLKLKIEIQYLCTASFVGDIRIILRTVGRVFNRREDEDHLLKEYLPAMNESEAEPPRESWTSSDLSSGPLLSELRDVTAIAKSSAPGRKPEEGSLPNSAR